MAEVKPIWPDDYLIPGIEPFHVEDAGIIYCADCRDILPHLPKVDLVLTDPPYGVEYKYDNYEDTLLNLDILIKSSIHTIIDSGKRTLITCGNDNLWIYPRPDWILAWINKAGANQNRWGFSCWQPILAYGKDVYRSNKLGARPDIIDHSECSEINGHPCPKPINFWKKLLLRGSIDTADIILDPFFGSGTTAVAAKELCRKFIGIEIEEKYCEIAVKRLRQGVLDFG